MNQATVYLSAFCLASLSSCIYCSDFCSQLSQVDSEAACKASSDDQGSAFSLLQTSSLQRRATSATRTNAYAELQSFGPEKNSLAAAIRSISNSDVAALFEQLQNPNNESIALGAINTTCASVPFLAGTVNMSVTNTLVPVYSALNDYMAALEQVQVQAQSTIQIMGDDSVYNWVSALVHDLDSEARQMQASIASFINSMRKELYQGLIPDEDANGNFNAECGSMWDEYKKASAMETFLTTNVTSNGTSNGTSLLQLMEGTNPVLRKTVEFFNWFWGHDPCKTPCCKAFKAIQKTNETLVEFAMHVETFNATDVADSLTGAVDVVNIGMASINQTMQNDLQGEALPAAIASSTQTAWDALTASTSSISDDIATLWVTVNSDLSTINQNINTLFGQTDNLYNQLSSHCTTTTTTPVPPPSNPFGPAAPAPPPAFAAPPAAPAATAAPAAPAPAR